MQVLITLPVLITMVKNHVKYTDLRRIGAKDQDAENHGLKPEAFELEEIHLAFKWFAQSPERICSRK